MKYFNQFIALGIGCFLATGCGAYASAQQLNKVAEGMHPAYHHYHSERREYMSGPEFQFLYNKIKGKPFKDDQMELLQVGCLDSRFSCEQCIRIMSIFTWDDDRLVVLRLMAKHIVDPENSISLLKAFDFDSSKRQVEGIMQNAGRH